MDIRKKIKQILEENLRLKARLKDTDRLQKYLFMDRIFKSNENVMRYTGFPNKDIFESIFSFVKSKGHSLHRTSQDNDRKKPGPMRKLSSREEFTLTRVRLRTGMLASLVADAFGVSESRVSQVFSTWINFLHQIFKPLIKWPSKSKVKKNMPRSFI